MSVLIIVFLFSSPTVFCQSKQSTDTLHYRKIYVVSGFGFGFPVGKTADVLVPRFSSNLGLDISVGGKNFFLYPSLDFFSHRYNQQVEDNRYDYIIEGARNNAYNLSVSAGIRKQLKKLNIYAFLGPGGGYYEEPRAIVNEVSKAVKVTNEFVFTASAKGGVGADYKLGSFQLFLEASTLHNFKKIQGRPYNTFNLFLGLKTDVTRLADKVIDTIL